MKSQIKTILTGIILLSLMTSNSVNGQTADTPWPCLQQNPQHTGQSIYAGPNHPTLAWKTISTGGFNGSPVLDSEGVIYIPGQDEYLYAYYPQGSLKWKFKGDSKLAGAPTISSDGIIYVGSTIDQWVNEQAKLYAVNPDGSRKWAIPLNGKEVLNCTIGTDGTIYVGSNNDDEKIYRIHAIYPSGGQKWEFNLIGPAGTPSIGNNGTIYVVAGTGAVSPYSRACYAFNADGTLKWRADNLGAGYVYGPNTLPVITPGGSIILYNYNTFVTVDQTGVINWDSENLGQSTLHWTASIPSVSSDGTFYFVLTTGDEYLFAINPDGSQKWNNLIGSMSAPPVIDAEGTVWLGANNGELHAFTPQGILKWSGYVTGGDISPMAVGTDRTMFFASSDNNLYAYFDPDSTINPDLFVSDISFDPQDGVNVGAQTTIRAEIDETSGLGPTRSNIIFYHTSIDPNNIIGSGYAFTIPGQKGFAEVVWNTQGLSVGQYTVIAVIESSNPPETNIQNNQKQTSYKLLKSLQQQINETSGELLVEPGTYKESISLRTNIVVRSLNGPNRTIIDGTGNQNVVLFNQLDATAVLDGFSIIGGGVGVDFERGGGIVRNCVIRDNNDGIYNIGSMVYPDPIIEYNIIRDNTRYAMNTNNSWALLNKNTIVNNGFGINGYGFYSSSPTIVNCILWKNNDDLVGTATATYSCIQNGDPGTGNISSDPLFVDFEKGDYHLAVTSPCINSGHPDAAYNDANGTRADMGAYYYGMPLSIEDIANNEELYPLILLQNYPNPFSGITKISYQLSGKSNIELSIYDPAGNKVVTLFSGSQSSGNYQFEWDAGSLPNGIYFARLQADHIMRTKKMILIK